MIPPPHRWSNPTLPTAHQVHFCSQQAWELPTQRFLRPSTSLTPDLARFLPAPASQLHTGFVWNGCLWESLLMAASTRLLTVSQGCMYPASSDVPWLMEEAFAGASVVHIRSSWERMHHRYLPPYVLQSLPLHGHPRRLLPAHRTTFPSAIERASRLPTLRALSARRAISSCLLGPVGGEGKVPPPLPVHTSHPSSQPRPRRGTPHYEGTSPGYLAALPLPGITL